MSKSGRRDKSARKEANSDPRFYDYEIKPVHVGKKKYELRAVFGVVSETGFKSDKKRALSLQELEILVAKQGRGPSREKDALFNLSEAEDARENKANQGLTAAFSMSRTKSKVRRREIEGYTPLAHDIFGNSRVGHSIASSEPKRPAPQPA